MVVSNCVVAIVGHHAVVTEEDCEDVFQNSWFPDLEENSEHPNVKDAG
jgi:hypothetical protein